jgi:hypothetical protein
MDTMTLDQWLTIAGLVLLALVWITEVQLVRALKRTAEQQRELKKTVGRVEGALDALADKLTLLVKRFG